MPNYNMRMPNRNKQNKVYLNKMPNSSPITQKSINSVPLIMLTNNKSLNNLIRTMHIRLLQEASLRKDGHKYDEVGILMELVEPYNCIKVYGEVNPGTGISSIDPKSSDFVNYIGKHTKNQLLFMHNHPNNSCFSYGDLYNFIVTDEIFTITAVGNSHGVHSMWKKRDFNSSVASKYLYETIQRLRLSYPNENIKKINSYAALQVISNADKINIGYRYSESRK